MSHGLVVALAQALAAQSPAHLIELEPRPDGIGCDEQLLDRLLSELAAGHCLRLWRQQRCLAVPRHFGRRAGFAEAAAASAEAGWPVVVRLTGGTAVPQHPGVLNVSLIGPAHSPSIDAGFEAFVMLIAPALATFGLALDAGPVDGACCDGRFNLRWQGRKLAGTAAAIRSRQGRRFMLVHAALVVEADLNADLLAVTRLEKGLGIDAGYAVEAHVTVAEALASARIDAGVQPVALHHPHPRDNHIAVAAGEAARSDGGAALR